MMKVNASLMQELTRYWPVVKRIIKQTLEIAPVTAR